MKAAARETGPYLFVLIEGAEYLDQATESSQNQGEDLSFI